MGKLGQIQIKHHYSLGIKGEKKHLAPVMYVTNDADLQSSFARSTVVLKTSCWFMNIGILDASQIHNLIS